MKFARIVSFIAFISNSFLSISFFFFFRNSQQLFEYLGKQMPIIWAIPIYLIFALVSIIYWFYLRKKSKEGKNVKRALLISIVLLIAPGLIVFPIALAHVKTIYEGIGNF
jgi:phosphoglycerol transferase MdoB-like AlkP superfamily enzyme